MRPRAFFACWGAALWIWMWSKWPPETLFLTACLAAIASAVCAGWMVSENRWPWEDE